MKVYVWGTGKGSEIAHNVCRGYEWDIVEYIDNDEEKQGKEFHSKKVISPETFEFKDHREICIMIATAAKEVEEQALKLSKCVINWKNLCFMNRALQGAPDYFSPRLQESNLKKSRILSGREELLKEVAKLSDRRLVMAEIGVADGDFSEKILELCSPKELHLIDAWDSERFEKGYEKVKNRFEEQITSGIVKIHRGFSTDRLLDFEDKELDFAYIDTVHDYDTTWQELLLCNKKVKDDGFICGHDYTKFNVYSGCYYGVYDAVNRFSVEYHYELLFLTLEPDGLQSFCLRKI